MLYLLRHRLLNESPPLKHLTNLIYQRLVDQLVQRDGIHLALVRVQLLAIAQQCDLASRRFHDRAAQKQSKARLNQGSRVRMHQIQHLHHQLC